MKARSRFARIGIAAAGLVAVATMVGATSANAAEVTNPVSSSASSSASQEAQPVTIFTKTVKVQVTNQAGSDLTMKYTVKSSGSSVTKTVANGAQEAAQGKSMSGKDLTGSLHLLDGTTIKWSAYNPDFGEASITINDVQYSMSDYSDPIDVTINGHKIHLDLTDGTFKQFEVTIY